MNKSLAVIFISLLHLNSIVLAFQPMEVNGGHWNKMNTSVKQGYLLGFLDALDLEKSKRLEHNTADATYSAVVAVIDSFYADPENLRIPAKWVISIACNRINGKFEAFENIEVKALREHYAIKKVTDVPEPAPKQSIEDTIFIAIMQDNFASVTRFIESGGNVNSRRSYGDQETLLISASLSGKTNIVEVLIRNNADPNLYGNDGRTALMKTCVGGHIGIAKLLLDHGADINARSKLGGSAIISAAFSGNIDLLELLIAKGADVNSKDFLGNSPLMSAVQNGHAPAIKLLLERGANPSIQDREGNTPANLARKIGRSDIVEMLNTAEMGH